MPFYPKYNIPPEVLEKVAAKELSCVAVGKIYGCAETTVRSQAQALTRKPIADRASMIDRGIGGDAKFDRLMGENRFHDCPRAIRDYGSPERLQAPSVQYSSYVGCAAALACA